MNNEFAKEWSESIPATEAAANETPVETSGDSHFPTNDVERAVRFAKEFEGVIRYVHALGTWFIWNGSRWAPDDNGEIYRKAQEIPKLLKLEAALIEGDRESKTAFGHAIRSGEAPKLRAMIELAKHQPGVATAPEIFDANPWLLGVKNGVVDLRTGEFRESSKEDFITKQAGVAYDPAARCLTWERFIERALNGSKELVDYAKRIVGYCLSGDTSEHSIFFCYGTGRNGKTTFTETHQALMGDYAVKASPTLLVQDRHGKSPEAEKARIANARLVVGSEVEEGSKLAESLIKDLTGGDTTTGRELFGKTFEYKPTQKLVMFGNHKPVVRGGDFGIWRRLKLIPFDVQIPDAEVDRELPAKLLAESSGILNWAIQGFLAWQKTGLCTPEAVLIATTEYKEEEDELGEFIGEKCRLSGEVDRKELYRAYKEWADEGGIRYVMKERVFAKKLREKNIGGRQSGPTRYWTGISVLPIMPEAESPTVIT